MITLAAIWRRTGKGERCHGQASEEAVAAPGTEEGSGRGEALKTEDQDGEHEPRPKPEQPPGHKELRLHRAVGTDQEELQKPV